MFALILAPSLVGVLSLIVSILLAALVVLLLFWVCDLIGFSLPPRIKQLIIAIVVLLCVLSFLGGFRVF